MRFTPELEISMLDMRSSTAHNRRTDQAPFQSSKRLAVRVVNHSAPDGNVGIVHDCCTVVACQVRLGW
jgi:hypothetical protein